MRLQLIDRVIPHIQEGKPAAHLVINENEWPVFKSLNLLSAKPMVYVCNVNVCIKSNDHGIIVTFI